MRDQPDEAGNLCSRNTIRHWGGKKTPFAKVAERLNSPRGKTRRGSDQRATYLGSVYALTGEKIGPPSNASWWPDSAANLLDDGSITAKLRLRPGWDSSEAIPVSRNCRRAAPKGRLSHLSKSSPQRKLPPSIEWQSKVRRCLRSPRPPKVAPTFRVAGGRRPVYKRNLLFVRKFAKPRTSLASGELVIERPFIWCAGWSIAAMRFAPARSHIRSGCRSGASHRHWFKHSDRGRDRPESSRHVSSGRPRKTGHPQCNRPAPICRRRWVRTVNLNIARGGDGTSNQPARFLPKETLVLVDGKRVAIRFDWRSPVSPRPAVWTSTSSPSAMIDHIDILKDGASAVYGSDAVTGVVNFFLIHKFRGLEIGGSVGNTNLGASNECARVGGWLKAGAGR